MELFKMTRSEILSVAKPILFNNGTEMVRAILDGRKTATRRPIKRRYSNTHIELRDGRYGKYVIELQNDVEGETYGVRDDGTHWQRVLAMREIKLPYKVGDILYVRETWCKLTDWEDQYPDDEEDMLVTYYRADYSNDMAELATWHPSIHMLKAAARLFLRVIHIVPQRIEDITEEQAKSEGFNSRAEFITAFLKMYPNYTDKDWVWVIEFERVGVK